MSTLVMKLLMIGIPDVAVFGEKDYQQLQIIRQMVRDLSVAVRIEGGATIRESDSLAMSSRNTYLNPAEREQAPALYRALNTAADRMAAGENVSDVLTWAREFVVEAGFRCGLRHARGARYPRVPSLTVFKRAGAAGCGGMARPGAPDRQEFRSSRWGRWLKSTANQCKIFPHLTLPFRRAFLWSSDV